MHYLMLKLIPVLLLSSSIFVHQKACSTSEIKSEKNIQSPNKAFPIHGLWIGSYTVKGEPRFGNQYFEIAINPNGTVIVHTEWEGHKHLSTGNWSMKRNKFRTTFTCVYGLPQHIDVVETFIGTRSGNGILVGTWENEPPKNGSGNVTLFRVN